MKLGPLQTEFIRALREDNIPQGFGQEFTIVPGEPVCRHCAFGVAVMTCVSNGLKLKWAKSDNGWYYRDSQSLIRGMLAMTFCGNANIIRMNDSKKLTFPEIAACIEANPAHYFERSV